jgi:4-hydroxy-3-polyprenylbenzoate decarboxylase
MLKSSSSEPNSPTKVCLCVTGASGARYALQLLSHLVSGGLSVDLVYSPSARRVLLEECQRSLDGDPSVLLSGKEIPITPVLHDWSNIGAAPASGSAGFQAVIVLPCSMHTLASIAEGRAGNLIERAAQVALKEGVPLVLCPRETPLSRTHLDQMSRLAWAGAKILPASPGFYHKPQSIEELCDHFVFKVLDAIQCGHLVPTRWKGSE